VGAASLFSLEMNEQIALDGEIVKGLVSALGSSKRNVLMAACNAVLDMSTTSVARQRLLELSALESLMWVCNGRLSCFYWLLHFFFMYVVVFLVSVMGLKLL